MIRRILSIAAAATLLAACSAPAAERSADATRGAPCDSLELSSPHGKVLESGRLILRWRAADAGPFDVQILHEDGTPAYSATTFGHELRVLISRGEGAMRGPTGELLEAGRTYRWTIRPSHAPDGTNCPAAEFEILSAEQSAAAQARFDAEAKRLRAGDEAAEPAAGLALARLYMKEGFYVLAERELERLIEEGWDDPQIDATLRDLYRNSERRLSLEALP